MRRVYILARFIGAAGSHGYQPMQSYNLEITQRWFGQKIDVRPTQGYNKKTRKDLLPGVYENLGDFMADWKVIEKEAVTGYFGD